MGPLFEEPREARPIGDRSFNSYSIGELRNPMAGRVVYALRTPSYVSGQPPRSDSISNNLSARNVLITIERLARQSTDFQLDRLPDTAEHFYECIDGELGRLLVDHVGHTRARNHQNLGGLGLL